MILLLGGTSEMTPIATALAERGLSALVSTATDFKQVEPINNVEYRHGALDVEGLKAIVKERSIKVIVDATHPYAVGASAAAVEAARACRIPYFRYRRPVETPPESETVIHAQDHVDAAEKAFSFGRPVLLTTGSRNVAPYADVMKRTGIPLYVRALPVQESIDACLAAGVARENIITGKGPFSVEDNVALIESRKIGALVTKDSGTAGGAQWKLEAAKKTGCMTIVVLRPVDDHENAYEDIAALADAVEYAATR